MLAKYWYIFCESLEYIYALQQNVEFVRVSAGGTYKYH